MDGLCNKRWDGEEEDFSSTQTDELFWSKVLQIRGVFHILSKIPEIMHYFVSKLEVLSSFSKN